MNFKNITDTKIADFTKTDIETLKSWKNSGNNVFMPEGKHNLYKGARIATYLLAFEENTEETSEEHNNLTLILKSIKRMEELAEIIKDNCKSKFFEELQKEIEFLKGEMENINELTSIF